MAPLHLPRREFLLKGSGLLAAVLGSGVVGAYGCARPTRSFPPLRALAASGPDHRPETFGDIGEDAAPAINAAIEACSRVGGRVLLRAGVTYPYRTRIRLRRMGAHRLYLEGERTSEDSPPTAVLRKVTSVPEATLNVQSDAVIANLHIRGPFVGRNPRAGNGVDSGETDGWGIYDCLIEGFEYNGINTGSDCRGVAIVRTTVRHNGDAGIQIGQRCEGCVIHGNIVHDNHSNGIDCNGSGNLIQANESHSNGQIGRGTDRQGIHLYAPPGASVSHNQVRNNDCHDNPRHGIVLSAPDGTMEDNVIAKNRCWNQISGIWIQGGRGHKGTVIESNVIRSNRGYGLGWGSSEEFGTFRDVQVRYNSFAANGEGGTWCHGAATFVGNTRDGEAYDPCG